MMYSNLGLSFRETLPLKEILALIHFGSVEIKSSVRHSTIDILLAQLLLRVVYLCSFIFGFQVTKWVPYRYQKKRRSSQ